MSIFEWSLKTVFALLILKVPGEAELEAATSKAPSKEPESKSAEEAKKQRPLLPKSSILRLISEIIKSYCSCTQLITQHIYQAGQSELITEVIVPSRLYTLYLLTLTTLSVRAGRELSDRALDLRPRGPGFEPHQHHCVVSFSKNINPSLVLIQPRKTRPFYN